MHRRAIAQFSVRLENAESDPLKNWLSPPTVCTANLIWIK